ncbi:MarR family transcriptional regulator [Sphingobacterium siyangense subsp. cladoniae]|uniref:MarR family winged helix-turn-helix transcriptional regulator n=1 Tax=Sphingobacterium siyangense TaxID=459529 RepID=UPI0031F8F0DF
MKDDNLEITDFDKEVAHRLRDLVSHLNRKLRKQISNKDQLSISELNVIKLLFENGEVLPSEICGHFNLSSQYVSQILGKLQTLGLITRKQAGTDKRKNFAIITKAGEKWLKISRQEREEWLATSIASVLTNLEKEAILNAIQLLNKTVGSE